MFLSPSELEVQQSQRVTEGVYISFSNKCEILSQNTTLGHPVILLMPCFPSLMYFT